MSTSRTTWRTTETTPGKSAVELSEFQEDAVKKARRVLARYDGVLVGDSVGLGKTWIGKKLLEDYAYHLASEGTCDLSGVSASNVD